MYELIGVCLLVVLRGWVAALAITAYTFNVWAQMFGTYYDRVGTRFEAELMRRDEAAESERNPPPVEEKPEVVFDIENWKKN